MITPTTLFFAASLVPTINISVNALNELVTDSKSICVGKYSYDPKHASMLGHEQTDLIDADDFLDKLLVKYDLKHDLPEARRWLAKELYNDSKPTLASLRLKKGLTQKQLASLIKEPQSSISRLESGEESPSIDRAAKIAEALDVSLDQFHMALTLSRERRKA